MVLHAVTPTWNDGNHNEIKILSELVKKCLACVLKDKSLRSIAFPALGCGMFKFPQDESTKAIAECLVNLANKSAPEIASITEIYLCDVNQDAVDAFNDALVDVCGAGGCHLKNKNLSSDDDDYANDSGSSDDCSEKG